MERAYIIIAYDGTEVIDKTLEVENRIADMNYLEEKRNRQKRWKQSRSVVGKFVARCGLL